MIGCSAKQRPRQIKPQHLLVFMWNFAVFLPAAVLLALLAVVFPRQNAAVSLGRATALAVGCWLLSWCAVVAILYVLSSAGLSSSFVPQRDVGYWIGSALFMAVPILVVLATWQAISHTRLSPPARRVTALATAAGAWAFTPWLFFVGWVFGCSVAGYSSCM